MLRVLLSSLSGQAPPSFQPGQHNGRNRTSWLQKNKPSVSQKPLEPWLQRASNSCSCSWTVAVKWPKEGCFGPWPGRGKWWDTWPSARVACSGGSVVTWAPEVSTPPLIFHWLAIEIFGLVILVVFRPLHDYLAGLCTQTGIEWVISAERKQTWVRILFQLNPSDKLSCSSLLFFFQTAGRCPSGPNEPTESHTETLRTRMRLGKPQQRTLQQIPRTQLIIFHRGNNK